MAKSTFKFVFPKKNMEYEALVNPYHIEPAAALAMAEHQTDTCLVYFAETLQFVCVHDASNKEKPFRYYYEDKREKCDVYLLIGDEDAIFDVNNDDIESLIENRAAHHFQLIHETFDSSEKAQAFMKGIELFCGTPIQDYTSVTEQQYDAILNRMNEE